MFSGNDPLTISGNDGSATITQTGVDGPTNGDEIVHYTVAGAAPGSMFVTFTDAAGNQCNTTITVNALPTLSGGGKGEASEY